MEKHIYFIRHGESDSNADGIHRGSEARLTEKGYSQAAAAAKRIKNIGVEALITSTFPRATETAAVIGDLIGLKLEQNEIFREWSESTNAIGLHRDDHVRKSAREAIFAAHHDPHHRHTDEETFAELSARADAALLVLKEHPASRICVVTHGGFLRAMVGAMTFGSDFTKKAFHHILLHFIVVNAGITYAVMEDESHGWRVVTLNDRSHLE